MAIYTVHVPAAVADPLRRAERTRFVRDGFSRGAFLFGPLHLLRHGAYVAAALWVAAVAALATLNHALRLPMAADVVLALLVMVFTGLEASSIRRAGLRGSGLQDAAVVSGSTLAEGEAAFFRGLAEPGSAAAGPAPMARAAAARPPQPDVIGSFPDPGP